jgi:hypothetical protein
MVFHKNHTKPQILAKHAIGFAVYGSYPDQHIKSSQEEVYNQFVEFISNYV